MNKEQRWKSMLITAAKAGDIKALARRCKLGFLQADPQSEALSWAAYNGHLECVEFLIPLCDVQANQSMPFRYAAMSGRLEALKLLLPFSDPKALNSDALRQAALYGHVECLMLLIPLCGVEAHYSLALQHAARNGHLGCLKLLLPLSDPKAQDSEAFRQAARNNHLECLELLLPFSDLHGIYQPRLSEALKSPKTSSFLFILQKANEERSSLESASCAAAPKRIKPRL